MTPETITKVNMHVRLYVYQNNMFMMHQPPGKTGTKDEKVVKLKISNFP